MLFTEHRVLKLADFGLAIDLNEERAVTRAGTLDYMVGGLDGRVAVWQTAVTYCVQCDSEGGKWLSADMLGLW